MKFLTTLLPLFLSSFAASKKTSFWGDDQKVLEDAVVPGKNPLKYCQQDTTGDLLKIKCVDLSPNPPEKSVHHALQVGTLSLTSPRGKTLTIQAKGNFTEEVAEGAYVNLRVKYGLITLINSRQDLCEQMKNVDEECPLEGEKVITKDVELPEEIPQVRSLSTPFFAFSFVLIPVQGKYTVLADVYTKDDAKVVCLEATVHF